MGEEGVVYCYLGRLAAGSVTFDDEGVEEAIPVVTIVAAELGEVQGNVTRSRWCNPSPQLDYCWIC